MQNRLLPLLGEIAKSTKGKKPKRLDSKEFEKSVPYLDIKAFEKGEIRQYAEKSTSNLIEEDQIAMVWDGARSGWVSKGKSGALGSTLAIVKTALIDENYLLRFLQSQFKTLNTETKGTGIPHVNPDVLWSLKFPLVPLNEQKRIADKLDQAFAHIDNLNKRLEGIPDMLKAFRRSVLHQAVTGKLTEKWREEANSNEKISELLTQAKEEKDNYPDKVGIKKFKGAKEEIGPAEINLLPSVPNEWEYIPIHRVMIEVTNGNTPKSQFLSRETDDVQFLKTHNLSFDNSLLEDKDPIFISNKTSKEVLKKSVAQVDDVIMNTVGPPVGKVSIVPDNGKNYNVNQNLTLYRTTSVVSTLYLSYFLLSDVCIDHIMTKATGSAGQIYFNLTNCRNIPFPFPSYKEQVEIEIQVKRLFDLADKIEKRFETIQKQTKDLPQSLLAKAFRGELVPQDPNDEPAEKLLERIKAEMETLKGKKKKGKQT